MTRCLLISNRLPVSFNEKIQEFVPSSGGLVSAIKGLDPQKVGYEFQWMGIMTDDVAPEKIQQLREISFGGIRCHPIMVGKASYDAYYNLYCNDVIWPLFHYERSMVHHSAKGWKNYKLVNQLVANAICEEATEKDTIWVHDFQLLLVPGMVKAKRPELKVSFFLHIPFPSSEIFRELPQREVILKSLLKCDLVGFHDLSYLTHFKTSLHRILGENVTGNDENKWGVYPISIDVAHFEQLAQDHQTIELIEEYQRTKGDKKWILGVDRLDYIKGLLMKLKAFREFLRTNPDQVGLIQFFQVVIPSRTDVPEYKNLKNRIEQLVSSINGEFGTPTYMPVHYLFHPVTPFELSALYQVSDVLHIGSRRDGMNLVSLEYVVSQQDDSAGTMLLSEFTGAHSTLSYAISINPWDIEGTALKMKEALTRPEDQRRSDMAAMKNFLKNYTSSDWAQVFLRDLNRHRVEEEGIEFVSTRGNFPWMKELEGKRVAFFCDLDGTLIPIVSHPSKARVQEDTAQLLRHLAKIQDCQFVIVSGRDTEFLEKQFIREKMRFHLAACHGAYGYSPAEGKWMDLVPHENGQWKEQALEALKLYTMRTPGSFIEDKGHAITWHYRNSPPNFAEFLANKLFIELEESLTSFPVQVKRGKKVIEVKSVHANKGVFVQQWLQQQPAEQRPEVVVALGDDTTDEDMFSTLQQMDIPAYCIKIGPGQTHARYMIKEQQGVNGFLRNYLDQVGHLNDR
jgi:trehalose 6-phosphate synthase/phosphatase